MHPVAAPDSEIRRVPGPSHLLPRATTVQTAAVAYRARRGAVRFLDRIVEAIADFTLPEINQGLVDRLAKELYPRASPATLKRQVYVPLIALMRFAASTGRCSLPHIKMPPVQSNSRMRSIRPGDFAALVECSEDHLALIMLFGVGTGARNSELIQLDWDDVDLECHEVEFPSRVARLPIELIHILRALPHKEGPIFRRHDGKPYAAKKYSAGQYKTALNTACRRSGVSDFRTSDFATTYAVWHLALHRDYKKLKADSGWPDHTIRRYKRVSVADLEQIRAALLSSPPKVIPGGLPSCATATGRR